MPKLAKELSALEVRRLTYKEVTMHGASAENERVFRKAYHAVGGVAGLMLQCSPPPTENRQAARSWILRVNVAGKRRDIGLGAYPEVSLAEAREKARITKNSIRAGIDPLEEKRLVKSQVQADRAKLVTFNQLADEYVSLKEQEFKSKKQSRNLNSWLDRYVRPTIGDMIVSDITVNHILKILEPIWVSKHDTAQRVRTHTEKIFKLAIVRELGLTKNPASYKENLDHLLISASKLTAKQENHPALQVKDMQYFWSKLTEKDSIGAQALKFLILTASRPGAVRFMQWGEIDWDKKLESSRVFRRGFYLSHATADSAC